MKTIFSTVIFIAIVMMGCTSPLAQTNGGFLPPALASPTLTTPNDITPSASPTSAPTVLNACGGAIDESEQVDFQAVYVGTTTTSEMLTILGEANSRDRFGREIQYIYRFRDQTSKTTNVLINTKNEEIESILEFFTHEDYDSYHIPYLVQDVISEHGCPELLFLNTWSEDGLGYLGAYLVYPQKGISFAVQGLPLTDTVPVRSQSYFQPTTATLYLERREDYLSGRVRYTTWAEASTWQAGREE